MSFSVTFQFPQALTQPVDVRQTFRDTAGSRMRRALEKVNTEAAAATPFQFIADQYKVVQQSAGQLLSFASVNDSPIWAFTENDTRPHWAPWGENTPLALWADRHGIKPFLVARKIAREGTTGNHIFQQTWDRNTDYIAQTMQDGVAAWLGRWGGAGE